MFRKTFALLAILLLTACAGALSPDAACAKCHDSCHCAHGKPCICEECKCADCKDEAGGKPAGEKHTCPICLKGHGAAK